MPTSSLSAAPVGALAAIYQRRSVRDYTPHKVERVVIDELLDAAVQAPTAMHEEPWGFVVIQDAGILGRLSESSKELVRAESRARESAHSRRALELVNREDFHVFYNVGALIVICSRFDGPFVAADCWLAAENLLLAACAKGLGSCVIGFAVGALNTPEWKLELKIPDRMKAIAPIIVGVPASQAPAVPRKKPEILAWI